MKALSFNVSNSLLPTCTSGLLAPMVVLFDLGSDPDIFLSSTDPSLLRGSFMIFWSFWAIWTVSVCDGEREEVGLERWRREIWSEKGR
jgi:hypothetical protein